MKTKCRYKPSILSRYKDYFPLKGTTDTNKQIDIPESEFVIKKWITGIVQEDGSFSHPAKC